eukprot:6111066-Amphidinium_carterae.1
MTTSLDGSLWQHKKSVAYAMSIDPLRAFIGGLRWLLYAPASRCPPVWLSDCSCLFPVLKQTPAIGTQSQRSSGLKKIVALRLSAGISARGVGVHEFGAVLVFGAILGKQAPEATEGTQCAATRLKF